LKQKTQAELIYYLQVEKNKVRESENIIKNMQIDNQTLVNRVSELNKEKEILQNK